MDKLKIYMECKGWIGQRLFNRFYKKHKHLCIEKTEVRAVFQEEGKEQEIKKTIDNINKLLPLFNQSGLIFSWKIEKENQALSQLKTNI